MNWNIVICDDEEIVYRNIYTFLKQLQQERGEHYTISYFSSSEKLLQNLSSDIHILLIDIGMEGLSGMEAAKILRKHDQNICLIFISSLTQYALEGYSVHAYGFMQKPLTYEAFRRQMEDAFKGLQNSRKVELTLPIGSGLEVISFDKVLYVEVYGRLICITQDDGKVQECRMSLTELEKQLNCYSFFRCHNNYLINFTFVEKFQSKHVIMADKKEIPVSKYRRKDMMSAFGRYVRLKI